MPHPQTTAESPPPAYAPPGMRRTSHRIARGAIRIGRVGIGAATASARDLPDFAIIGAQRSGTTSLHRYLGRHQGVSTSWFKEIQFFDRHFARGPRWYRRHFASNYWRAYVRHRYGLRPVTGEASPSYLASPHAPRRMAELMPQARLIVMLRNPVDRAFSHYQHERALGRETLTFEQAIEMEEERTAGEYERMKEDEDYFSLPYHHYAYLTRGIYVDQLQHWYSAFPREQVLVISSERFWADPSGVLRSVFQFLDLPPMDFPNYSPRNSLAYDAMAPETRRRLTDSFQPHNRSLRDLLGFDPGWTSTGS